MNKLISVVIPTWNRPQLLRNCLLSLACQSLDEDLFEVIVVSDGPDPQTGLMIDKLNHQLMQNFIFLSMPVKRGPAAARNLGWKAATAPLVAFTDDDCIPEKKWLAEITEAYNGEMLAAYSGRLLVPLPDDPTDHEHNTFQLEKADFITANCAVTKAALGQIGGFDERYTMAWREDSDLEFNLIRHGVPIMKLTSAVVVHPVRKVPWGHCIKDEKKGMFNVLLQKKYPDLYERRINSRPPAIYYAMIVAVLLFLYGAFIRDRLVCITGMAGWTLVWAYFTTKRLSGKSRSPAHILEMMITSAIIPFTSVYWYFYGLVKFNISYKEWTSHTTP